MDFYNELEQLCNVLERELKTSNEKLESSGNNLTGDDLSYIDKLTHSIKSIKTTMAMMDSEGYSGYGGNMGGNMGGNSGRYYQGNYSGRGRRRDSMGRYSRSRGRYSGNDEMVDQLRELMEDAPDDRTRQEFQKFISKVESM